MASVGRDCMNIEGMKIVKVRELTAKEMDSEGWIACHRTHPIALVLDNGAVLFASQDDEGNGPGAMFGHSKEGGGFRVTAVHTTKARGA